MGAWGSGMFDDDVALDVCQVFEDAVEDGLGPEQAVERVLAEMSESLQDSDERPVVLYALTSLLLDSGVHDHPVIGAAREAIDTGAGLERWEEAGPEALAERREILSSLLARMG
jgi:hypothetical protein